MKTFVIVVLAAAALGACVAGAYSFATGHAENGTVAAMMFAYLLVSLITTHFIQSEA